MTEDSPVDSRPPSWQDADLSSVVTSSSLSGVPIGDRGMYLDPNRPTRKERLDIDQLPRELRKYYARMRDILAEIGTLNDIVDMESCRILGVSMKRANANVMRRMQSVYGKEACSSLEYHIMRLEFDDLLNSKGFKTRRAKLLELQTLKTEVLRLREMETRMREAMQESLDNTEIASQQRHHRNNSVKSPSQRYTSSPILLQPNERKPFPRRHSESTGGRMEHPRQGGNIRSPLSTEGTRQFDDWGTEDTFHAAERQAYDSSASEQDQWHRERTRVRPKRPTGRTKKPEISGAKRGRRSSEDIIVDTHYSSPNKTTSKRGLYRTRSTGHSPLTRIMVFNHSSNFNEPEIDQPHNHRDHLRKLRARASSMGRMATLDPDQISESINWRVREAEKGAREAELRAQEHRRNLNSLRDRLAALETSDVEQQHVRGDYARYHMGEHARAGHFGGPYDPIQLSREQGTARGWEAFTSESEDRGRIHGHRDRPGNSGSRTRMRDNMDFPDGDSGYTTPVAKPPYPESSPSMTHSSGPTAMPQGFPSLSLPSPESSTILQTSEKDGSIQTDESDTVTSWDDSPVSKARTHSFSHASSENAPTDIETDHTDDKDVVGKLLSQWTTLPSGIIFENKDTSSSEESSSNTDFSDDESL